MTKSTKQPAVHGRRLPASRMWLLTAMLLLLAVPVPGAAASSARDELDAIRDEVDAVLDSISGQNSLNKSELAELRRDLRTISRDLDSLRDQLGGGGGIGGGGGQPSHPGGDWRLYQQADSEIWPNWAKFASWHKNRKFTAETDDEDGTLHFTVDNVDYTAEWTIERAYSSNPRVTVDPMATGDIYLTVRDNRGSQEFLLKNGGIGPLYTRRAQNGDWPDRSADPPAPGGRMGWTKPYYDLVKAGQLGHSAGMDWFIDQVQREQYAAPALAELGNYLRDDLPEQVQGEIAVLEYSQLFQTKRISVSDPRNSVATFVYAMDKAYSLYQDGTDFTVELT